jgi:predicted alpha/beta superfamily hydrolase
MHSQVSQLRRHPQFHSQFLAHDRDVLVWLPPGYPEVHDGGSGRGFIPEVQDLQTTVMSPGDEPSFVNRRYPVLYMHDGQNLFEPDTAFQKGEHWRVGETATELIEAGRIEPLIVVGIYNTGEARLHEYTPTDDAKLGGGQADDYGRMIIGELKPLIDRTYQTQVGRDSTGIAGSSLGGLVSLHLAFNHPAIFGRAAALSPSVWWDRKAILKTIRGARGKPNLRLWVDMGTAEGRRGLDDARLLKAALVGLGFLDGVDLHYAEYEGATHSEQAWSERVGPMLEWLFPAPSRTVNT